MKIVFLSRYQDNLERGAEVFVKELAQRLAKNNEVEILSGRKADSLGEILKGKYQIVIPMNGGWQSLIASFGRLLGNYQLVIIGQSGIGKDSIWNIALCQPDIFVALTEDMADWAKKWAWRSRVVKIPNGVDLNRFKEKGEKINLGLARPIILSVGALSWYKHHEKVIKAVGELLEGSLLLVGKGEEEENLLNFGKKTLGSRFKIINLPNQDMPKVYRSCDIFTLPSWGREAFGNVYIEALACGLPVVAPDDLPRREIVGEAGVFVNVDNPKEYAKALNETLKTRWNGIPRKQAEKFSWDRVAQMYEEALKK